MSHSGLLPRSRGALVVGFLILPTTPAWSASPARRPPAELLRAARTGRIRVLAMLDVGSHGPEFPASPAGRAAIRAAADSVLARLPAGQFELGRRYETVNALALEVSASGLRALAADPLVTRVDLDEIVTLHLPESVPLTRMDVVQAAGYTGKGVRVAVIDTGTNLVHPDLTAGLVAEQCLCAFLGGCCPNGGTTQSGPASAQDDHGHGSNVTGIITSRGAFSPVGGAPGTETVAVKTVAANGNGFASDTIAGMDWVRVNEPTVRVVNMSLGYSGALPGHCDAAQPAFAVAINNLRVAGMLVTVSAGNQGSGTGMSAPACIENATSVGAVWDANVGAINILGCTEISTAPDQVTCFSNSSSTTDLFAPGAPITSCGLFGPTSTFYGTSMAAPMVAACAADLFEARPSTTPAEMEAALKSSLVLVTDVTNGLSFPRLDCERALQTVLVELQSFTIE